jgi:hypothetical protein
MTQSGKLWIHPRKFPTRLVPILMSFEPQLGSSQNSPSKSEALLKVRCRSMSLRRCVISPTSNPKDGGSSLVGCPRLLVQYPRSYSPYLKAVFFMLGDKMLKIMHLFRCILYVVRLWSSRNDFIARLKGAVRLDPSKDMSAHVSTCTSYGFNTLTPVVCKLWRWYYVCVSASRRKNEWSIFRATNQH